MQPLKTIVQLPTYSFKITHSDKIFTIGSCFANMMATKLHDNKFSLFGNPMGIVYNPVSLAQQLEHSIAAIPFVAEDIFQSQDLWHSFMHHSRFSDIEQDAALERMNKYLKLSHQHLQKSTILIITLGTANAYYHWDTKQIVANCHKLPAADFEKRQLSVREIEDTLRATIEKLKVFNPDLQIVLSVSPVRHFRDGYIQSQRSKAALLLATATLENEIENVHYFPAYEILLDELRDYRFYGRDMVHPSDLAKDYIWDKFTQVFFEEGTTSLMKKIQKIVRASNHKPFQVNTPKHQRFVGQQLLHIQSLVQQYPHINLNTEIAKFQQQLAPTIEL